jgi:mono/diheme cytochrome c family protein
MVFKCDSRRNTLFIVGFCSLISLSGCRFYFKTTTDTFVSHASSTSVENGKNLTFTICAGCHYDQKVGKFIGKSLNDLPRIAGKLYSANLTHSTSNGRTSQYSDAELFYLLKTGIAKNGKFMPYMMKPMMADADVNDIIVFLRSDDPSLASADTTTGKTKINLIGKTGIRLFAKPQPYNKGVSRPDENNPVTYGQYLVGIIGCYHCHSQKVGKLDFLNPESTKGYMIGGMKLKDPKGNHLRAPNLTPDKETGIGNFSKEDFFKAVRDGETPSGRKLSPPMPKFKAMTDEQTSAIYDYLRTLPPVNHKVKRRNA